MGSSGSHLLCTRFSFYAVSDVDTKAQTFVVGGLVVDLEYVAQQAPPEEVDCSEWEHWVPTVNLLNATSDTVIARTIRARAAVCFGTAWGRQWCRCRESETAGQWPTSKRHGPASISI